MEKSDAFKNQCCLDSVAAQEAGAVSGCGGNCVQAVALCALPVDNILKLGKITGTRSDELLLESYLKHNITWHC